MWAEVEVEVGSAEGCVAEEREERRREMALRRSPKALRTMSRIGAEASAEKTSTGSPRIWGGVRGVMGMRIVNLASGWVAVCEVECVLG